MIKNQKKFNPLSNERGALVLITIIIISVVLVIFSGIVTFKLAEVARQAHRVNQAYKYLNIMEEMGLLIARARELGTSVGAGTCPAGTFKVAIDTTEIFCLPGSSLATTCIEDTSQQDVSGTNIKYCLQVTNGLDTETGGVISAAKNEHSPQKADLTFDIVAVKEKSILENIFRNFMTITSVNAACPPGQNWNDPCTIDDGGSTAPSTPTVVAPYTTPASYSVAPGGTAVGAPGTLVSRNNLEPWSPTALTWSPSTANEIYTPKCDSNDQYWLGCMRCSDAQVMCIDIRMCPPIYTSGSACTQPYRQRIAVYDHR